MLKELFNLEVFFEDCYRRVSVREYAKLIHVAPPTASSLLKKYYSEHLLLFQKEHGRHFFYANKDSNDFIDLSRMYWRNNLQKIVNLILKQTVSATIVLYGSLSKGEANVKSDVDIMVFSPEKKKIHLENEEKKLKRKISILQFTSLKEIQNEHLRNNVMNGYKLCGFLR